MSRSWGYLCLHYTLYTLYYTLYTLYLRINMRNDKEIQKLIVELAIYFNDSLRTSAEFLITELQYAFYLQICICIDKAI